MVCPARFWSLAKIVCTVNKICLIWSILTVFFFILIPIYAQSFSNNKTNKKLELYTESVFFGRYRSVFLGIYHTDTEGKLGQYFPYQKIGGSPTNNWREPPFSQEGGGLGPLFVHFALLLKKKKNSRGIIQKKEFPQNLKKGFPPKLTVQQYRPKNTDTGCI